MGFLGQLQEILGELQGILGQLREILGELRESLGRSRIPGAAQGFPELPKDSRSCPRNPKDHPRDHPKEPQRQLVTLSDIQNGRDATAQAQPPEPCEWLGPLHGLILETEV